MNTKTTVEVYLGNPITVASEERFVARLRHDLLARDVSARILANVHLGRDDRQIDFVVITGHRVIQVEEKTFPGPIVHAPRNGPWKFELGESEVREHKNPVQQAIDATYALSDELHAFAASRSVPGPRQGKKFYRDIDTVVCGFPALPDGSKIEGYKHVSVLGYDELMDRLQHPGPSLAWSEEDWDALCRHLNLYREAEDSPEGVVRSDGAAAVDEYRGRFLQGRDDRSPLVPTAVQVGGVPAPRPDLRAELTAGRGVLLHGPSGFGKTLWARGAAVELARAGHVPIWLAAEVCETSFGTATARAIAPYTSLSPNELLKAADVAGRAVVFIVDDLSKADDDVQQALLNGVRTARVRQPSHGLLITAQVTEAAASVPECLGVELSVPDAADRQAVLDAYGAPTIMDRCDAFRSPLELSLAASYAGELPSGASATLLLDRHVDALVRGDDRLRSHLRAIAARMHSELMPSLSRPDVVRMLRRDNGLDGDDVHDVLSCPLVTVAHGRVSFCHERFENFLAAEAMLVDATDIDELARSLNTPHCADLRVDVVALESDEGRVGRLLAACTHPDVLVAAATGRLGATATRAADALLAEALNIACAQTTVPGIAFDQGSSASVMFDGNWVLPEPPGAALQAQLFAVGRLVREGRFVAGAARLIDLTDELCAATLSDSASGTGALAEQVFAVTYVVRGADALPASVLVGAATSPSSLFDRDPTRAAQAAAALLHESDGAPGVLYVAAHLVHHPYAPPLVVDVIVKCLASPRYHLRLEGLRLAEDSRYGLDAAARRTVADAVRELTTDHLLLNSSIVEVLSAYGELEPNRNLDDVNAEIDMVLSAPRDELNRKRAYGIVSAQFETEALGPYGEAINKLPADKRQRLLAMALLGSVDGISTEWIVKQFDDLSDSFTRDAVIQFAASSDPTSWLGAQWGMSATVTSLALLAADGAPLPDPIEGGSVDPAWRASMAVITGALADAHGWEADRQAVQAAWEALLGEHRDALASMLMHVGSVRALGPNSYADVHEQVLAAMPAGGVDALVWSLEHLDQTRSLCRWDHDLARHVISVLGQLGDRRAGDALRRFVDDAGVGEAAAAAVRAIEQRAIA
jgi:hypothetical protein